MKLKAAAILLAITSFCSNTAHAGYGHEGKTYTKFDLGYGIQDHQQAVTGAHIGNTDDSGAGFMFETSFGHYLLDELRIDLQLHFDRGLESKQTFTSGADQITMKGDEATFGGFVNVYYDWLNSSNITPYVTVGAGLTRNEFTSRIAVGGGAVTKGRKSKYGTSYKAGLGAAYHISSNVDLDIGYSYLQKGVDKYDITIASPAVSVIAEPGTVHSMMFGIRLTY